MNISSKILMALIAGTTLLPSLIKAGEGDVRNPGESVTQNIQSARSSPVSLTDAMPRQIENMVKIHDAHVEGTNLVVTLSYGGGCKPQNFSFQVWSGIQESYPPRTVATITKQGENDTCERYISENLKFDLQPLVEHVGKLYDDIPSVLLLRLNGYGLVSFTMK